MPLGEPAKQRQGDRLVTFIPMRVKKRGFKKFLIGPKATGAAAREEARSDSPLIKSVARAFHCRSSWTRGA